MSPEDRILELERQLRESEARVAEFRDLRDAAVRDLANSDSIRTAMFGAAKETSGVAERAMDRIMRMQPVVDAAEHLYEDLNDTARHFALHEAIEAWQKVKPC